MYQNLYGLGRGDRRNDWRDRRRACISHDTGGAIEILATGTKVQTSKVGCRYFNRMGTTWFRERPKSIA